jgi:hypothetical protein
MTGTSAFVTRNLVGVTTAALASLALPYVIGEVSWQLSHALDPQGGMHITSVGFGNPNVASLLGTSSLAILVCMAADTLRIRLPWLSWVFPICVILLAGLATGYLTAREAGSDQSPWYAPLVVGVSFAVLAGLLVGSYWLAILATSTLTERMVPESRSRRTKS